MTDLSVSEGSQPPKPGALVDEPRPSRWPSVIGVCSIMYALGGLLCAIGVGAWSFFTDALMRMGGMDVSTPLLMKITGGTMALLQLIAGVVLLSGAIATLRRKRSGPATLKKWALFRMGLLLLNAVMTVVTAPAQIQFQRSMIEAQQKRAESVEQGSTASELTDDEVWTRTMLGLAVMSGVFAVYPLFIGFYLSRKKINDEVAVWR
jgi:hypothetical protein